MFFLSCFALGEQSWDQCESHVHQANHIHPWSQTCQDTSDREEHRSQTLGVSWTDRGTARQLRTTTVHRRGHVNAHLCYDLIIRYLGFLNKAFNLSIGVVFTTLIPMNFTEQLTKPVYLILCSLCSISMQAYTSLSTGVRVFMHTLNVSVVIRGHPLNPSPPLQIRTSHTQRQAAWCSVISHDQLRPSWQLCEQFHQRR